jgi:glycosyltransferase involved in cell wall biosynthesis
LLQKLENPLVSVVIPTFNRAISIRQTIISVMNQTHKNIEIIVVDDASTDETIKIVEEMIESSSMPIQLIKNDINQGGAVTRNSGAKLARGKYLAFLDSDDIFKESHLQTVINLFRREKNTKGIFGNFVIDNGRNKVKSNLGDNHHHMGLGNYIISKNGDCRTSTMFFERLAFLTVQFDEKLRKHQDWDLAICFNEKYNFKKNNEYNVIINVEQGNRMSHSQHHDSTEYFLEKHCSKFNNKYLKKYIINKAFYTVIQEGKNLHYYKYIKLARSVGGFKVTSTKELLLFLPEFLLKMIYRLKKI